MRQIPEDHLKELKDPILRITTLRAENAKVAEICREAGAIKRAEKLERCGQYASVVRDGTRLKLVNISRCKDRGCSYCESVRQCQFTRDFEVWFNSFLRIHNDSGFLALSVGFRTLDVTEVKSFLKLLNEGFSRFTRRRATAFPATGWLIAKEFPFTSEGIVHPNVHLLLSVPSDYFASGYQMSPADWNLLIQSCLRLEEAPSTRVERIRGRRTAEVLENATRYFSYVVKPQLPFRNSDRAVELLDQLSKSPTVTFGGDFRRFRQLHKNPITLLPRPEYGLKFGEMIEML